MSSNQGMKRQPQRTEKEVGIHLFIGQHERFKGVIKERFSDFHVNEIGPDGKTIHLTSFDLPNEVQTDVALNDPVLLEWINEETRVKIQALQDSGTTKSPKVELNVTAADKDVRTKIHRWLAGYDKLQSETIDTDGQKWIHVFIPSKANARFVRRPYNRAKYTHAVLYKEGLDTSDAVQLLCRKLSLQPKHITYAGTKDKQAKTVQRVCFSNIEAKRLLQLNSASHFKLGNFEYHPQIIRLGELKGNHFKILIKKVELESDQIVETAVNSLATNGFINYYGLQRFGTYKVPTYLIGKAIIQMKWIDVFDLILQPNDHDQPFMKAAKELWLKKRDASLACKKIPYYHRSLETNLLNGLAKSALTDSMGAFKSLPRNIRTLYIHAYQSFLWNQVVTFRIQEYGMKPIVGDLVYVNPELGDSAELDCDSDEAEEDEDKSGANAEEKKPFIKKLQVKVLTEEDLPHYSIYDIVLPLQGTEVKFPDNAIKKHFNELLIQNGFRLDDFEKFTPRCELPRGDYRKIMVLPKHVSHKIIPYNDTDPLDTFIASDLDVIKAAKEDCDPPKVEFGIPPPPKDKKAVIVEFSLPSSSYATMALRELMGGDEREIASEDDTDGKKRRLPVVEKASEDEAVASKRSCIGEESDLSAAESLEAGGNELLVQEEGSQAADAEDEKLEV